MTFRVWDFLKGSQKGKKGVLKIHSFFECDKKGFQSVPCDFRLLLGDIVGGLGAQERDPFSICFAGRVAGTAPGPFWDHFWSLALFWNCSKSFLVSFAENVCFLFVSFVAFGLFS